MVENLVSFHIDDRVVTLKCKSLVSDCVGIMCVVWFSLNRYENGSKANQGDYRSREVACIDGDPASGRVVDVPPQTRRFRTRANIGGTQFHGPMLTQRHKPYPSNVWWSYPPSNYFASNNFISKYRIYLIHLIRFQLTNLITGENMDKFKMTRLYKLFLINTIRNIILFSI